MDGERICSVAGCSNLGGRKSDGKRYSKCQRHLGHYDRQDRRNADRLLAGEQIKSKAMHHRAVRVILNLPPGHLSASRTCGEDCPHKWEGYAYRHGVRYAYPLCVPEHYVAESMAANLERRRTA